LGSSYSENILLLDSFLFTVFVFCFVEGFTFKALSTSKVIQPGFIITNVVPGDYNYDGKLDVLLMGEQNPDKNPTKEIKMQIYLGNGNDSFGKYK
jgi:integrin alpha FG-GAP repeat containing protein 1